MKQKKFSCLKMVLVVAVVLCAGQKQVQAEETGVDASVTTPQTFSVDAGRDFLLVPISFPKAGLYQYNIAMEGFGDGEKTVYEKRTATEVEFINVRHFKGTEYDIARVVKSPANLYLMIGADNTPQQEKKVTITCKYFPATASGREIKAGETVESVGLDNLYYSFTLKKDASVTISASEGSVALYDSKKESLGYYANQKDSAVVYLKKGKYYLGTREGRSVFKYTTKNLTLPKNTTKKKAATIKLGKKQKIIFPSVAKGTKVFYKLTLKYPKKLSVTYDTSKMDGAVSVNIFKTKESAAPSITGNSYKKKGKIEFEGTVTKSWKDYFSEKKSVKLSAGTWYIEVSNTSGGEATIMIK